MDTSLESMLGTASSRASSLASFGNLADERDFDRLSPVIPDSHPANTLVPSPPSKKFSAPKEEVSESALSEGFSWSVKPPPRPGQFSRRPNHQPAPLAGPVSHSRQTSIVSQSVPPKLATGNMPQIQRVIAPLDLPELGLLGSGSREEHLTVGPVVNTDSPKINRSVSRETSDEVGCSEPLPRSSCDSPTPSQAKIDCSSDTDSSEGDHLAGPSHRQNSSQDAGLEPQAPTTSRPRDLAELSKSPLRPIPHDRQRLDDLKLPLPHGPHVLQSEQSGQHSSVCGDLERPAAQTPKSSRRRSHEAKDRMPSRPIRTPRQQEEVPKDRHRSQSRASNISKKRSSVEKHRNRANPERKKEVMHHVAQYWNECMRISEEERQEATWEIEKLQTEINHREEDLNKTCVLLSEKENEIKDALDRCQKLEDKEHQATDENQRLSGEIESLRDQLGKSEEYGAELKAKYNAYREKLNEAIAEQQALFTRSKLFYRKARKELEKERSKRTTDTEAIDGALEASRNKREELKNCLEELRTQTEQEGRKKDQIVSELEAKLREQEAELTRERDSAIELRQRIEENKTVQETVTRVESQVQALLENSTYSDANDQKQTEVTSQLSTKLDRILEHLNSSTNNAVTPAAIEPIIERLERKIISRILPAVLTVISGQTQAEESFEKLTGDVLTRLTQIQSDVADGDERRSQYEQSEEATGRDILDHLVRIDARTANAEKTYKQTERQFADWTHSEARQRESFEASFRDQITEQLGDRDFVLGELEQKLHSVVEDYSNKIDSMKDLILQSDEEAKKHLQGAIDAIRHTLENGFKEESARTEREISQSEGIRAALEIHLKEVREKLAVPSRSDPNSGALRHELDEERQTVIELRQKLAQLESEATTNENIHERWQQDIKAIGMMRDQLNEMSGRVPDMTSLEAKFQNMAQINQVMDSTAKYLMAERSWVSQQLGVKTKLDDPSIKADGERQEPQAGDLEREVIASNPQLVVTDTQAISVKSESATDISFQDESTSRKVVVYSPRGDAVSPSPPPSIAQEQLRRREAALPRSILRVTPSSQETTQESIPRIPPNHSKYNRPVTGKVSSTAASAKQGVIDQIRFGLVQPKPVQKSWDLTTVADFERNIKPGRDRAGAKEKKHLLIPTERVESPSPKKVKTESGSSQTGAVLKDRQQRQKPAKNPRILKTYSRKQINEE